MVRDNDGRRRARAETSHGRSKPAEQMDGPPNERHRIAKVMARAGLCSRREAEAWIVDGRVSVNGAILTSPAMDVGGDDIVLVDGTPLPPAEKTRLFLFHKPRGLVTSDHDPEGRATVTAFLREHWPGGPRVVTIGRLDINTEGLLLLTNDGGLARTLELPRTGWLRRYRVRAKGETDQGVLDGLAHGLSIDGVDYAGIEAKLDRVQGANCWLTMGLREGKNREIKRVLEHIGLEVNRLIRLSFGPFQLRDLAEGTVEEVRTRVLRDQLGENLMAAAGVDLHEIEDPEIEQVAPNPAIKRFVPPRLDQKQSQSNSRTTKIQPLGPRVETRDRQRSARQGCQLDPRSTRDQNDASAPRARPVAGTRKHVSKLRAEAALERGGPRKRIDRTDTTDRKARVVAVERILAPAGAAALEPTRSRKHARSPLPSADRLQRGPRRHSEGQKPQRETSRPNGAGQSPRKGKPSRGDMHRSPSALAKQMRMARSGGEPARSRRFDERGAAEDAKSRGRVRRRETTAIQTKPNSAVRRDTGSHKPGPAKPRRNKPPHGPRVPPRGTRASRPER